MIVELPALSAFVGIAEAWRLNEQEQMLLLGISESLTLQRWREGLAPEVRPETLERISHLLGIFKAINTLLPDPGRADAWMRAPNKAPLFGGQSALERMTSGSVDDLASVRQYLEAQLV